MRRNSDPRLLVFLLKPACKAVPISDQTVIGPFQTNECGPADTPKETLGTLFMVKATVLGLLVASFLDGCASYDKVNISALSPTTVLVSLMTSDACFDWMNARKNLLVAAATKARVRGFEFFKMTYVSMGSRADVGVGHDNIDDKVSAKRSIDDCKSSLKRDNSPQSPDAGNSAAHQETFFVEFTNDASDIGAIYVFPILGP